MYKYACYVADGTKGASYYRRPETSGPRTVRIDFQKVCVLCTAELYLVMTGVICTLYLEEGGLVRRPSSLGRVASGRSH